MPIWGFVALTKAANSARVTGPTPTAKGCAIVTWCLGRSWSLSLSLFGAPIRNVPAGTTIISGPLSKSRKRMPAMLRVAPSPEDLTTLWLVTASLFTGLGALARWRRLCPEAGFGLADGKTLPRRALTISMIVFSNRINGRTLLSRLCYLGLIKLGLIRFG